MGFSRRLDGGRASLFRAKTVKRFPSDSSSSGGGSRLAKLRRGGSPLKTSRRLALALSLACSAGLGCRLPSEPDTDPIGDTNGLVLSLSTHWITQGNSRPLYGLVNVVSEQPLPQTFAVALASSDPSLASLPQAIQLTSQPADPVWVASGTFEVTRWFQRELHESPRWVVFSASYGGAVATTSRLMRSVRIQSVHPNPITMLEGDTATVTIELEEGAPIGANGVGPIQLGFYIEDTSVIPPVGGPVGIPFAEDVYRYEGFSFDSSSQLPVGLHVTTVTFLWGVGPGKTRVVVPVYVFAEMDPWNPWPDG